MAASSLNLLSSTVLVLCFSLGSLHAACVPPPSVDCSSNFGDGDGCHIFNAMGIWEDRSTCKAAKAAFPRSEAELIHAVAGAVKKGQKIKVISTEAHSLTKLACVENKGLIISTKNYNNVISINKTAMTITVQAGTMMREVIAEAAVEGLALPAMIYWNGVSAAGVISSGAHGTSLAGRGGGVYEYAVAMRLVVPASPSEGYAKVISLTEADQDMKAARISLGTLGAISEITFALQPMFKRSFSASLKDDKDLEKEAAGFLKAIEYGDINWFPSHGKTAFLTNYRVPVDVPGDGLNTLVGSSPLRVVDIETFSSQYDALQATPNIDGICGVLERMISSTINGNGFLNDGNRFTGYPVIGFNHRMQASGGCQGFHPNHEVNIETCTPTKILDKNNTVCPWDHRTQNNLFFDVELRVPLSRLQDAILDVKKIRDLNPRSMCDSGATGGIYMRTIKKSEAYLGPAHDMVTFEMGTYRPRDGAPKWNGDVLDELEQMVVEKYGGEMHWGKTGGHLFDGLMNRTVNLKEFLKVKERFDPDQLFSNDFTDGLFGIRGRRVEVLRDGCGLDKMCKCREDKHCAPDKGYLCTEGRVWKNARVCRKMDV